MAAVASSWGPAFGIAAKVVRKAQMALSGTCGGPCGPFPCMMGRSCAKWGCEFARVYVEAVSRTSGNALEVDA
jgi:hypothetical protein